MDENRLRSLQLTAAKIRKHTLQAIHTAGSGHIGGSFSLAEILTTLYFDQMNVDPNAPSHPQRDRFVLSKGHTCPAVYSALALKGFFPLKNLAGLRKIDSDLSGHIEMTKIPGVDMSAGSLGQGLSVAAGMALSAKAYGDSYRVYCVTGDGEMQEGQIWEALMAAGNYRLDNLVLIVDDNKLQIDGPTDQVMSLKPLDQKLAAFGWNVIEVDGHDIPALVDAFEKARATKGKPSVLIADTVKGKGVSVFEHQVRFHGGQPTVGEYDIAFAELDARTHELEG